MFVISVDLVAVVVARVCVVDGFTACLIQLRIVETSLFNVVGDLRLGFVGLLASRQVIACCGSVQREVLLVKKVNVHCSSQHLHP